MNKKRTAMVAILLVAVLVVAIAAPMQRFGTQGSYGAQIAQLDESQIPAEILAYRQARIDALAAEGVDTSTLGVGGAIRARQNLDLENCDPELCEFEPLGRGPMAANQVTTGTYGRYAANQSVAYGRGSRGMMGRW